MDEQYNTVAEALEYFVVSQFFIMVNRVDIRFVA